MDQRDSTVHSNKRQRTMPDVLPIVAESSSLTKRLVGDAFQRNEKKIWAWLMDDQVLRVGICGMGGVGKTTLMRHIQTRLKRQSSVEVFWVTVSQDFSIWKLQNLIAKKIYLIFSDNDNEVDRAEKLTQALKAKGKCVLILDNLWDNFDVDEVGIPVRVNTCKLVLTTRLLNVCRQMNCSVRNTIQVQALSKGEAWILFTQELGNYRAEVEELAKAVSRECAGLPLGIRVMARSMKGICNVHTWRNTLEELQESKFSCGYEMEEVFSVLKFSYLHLIDPALQKCLLYCALFPEDHKIPRDELIEYMIVEGIIDAKKSRRAEFDRGHTMLDTLVNACLLEGDTTDVVWMHDLIRDMAIYELRERSNTLMEAGAQLKELPDVEEWTENLVCVSLMYNDIKVIPSGHTPRCPNLSTLLLRGNYRLREIAGSFLEQFQILKVLDLSGCKKIEELPVYVSDLVHLTALLLRECRKLSHVPSLAKLERLKKLDLSSCQMLERMPEGVEFLINLKHLDLSLSGIERIGSEIIPQLSRLQVLNLGKTKVSVKGKEVGRLEKLEILECNFDDTKEWKKYMKSREKSQQSLTHYFFIIGEVIECWHAGVEFFQYDDWRSSSGVYLWGGGSSSNDYVALPLPADIQALIIEDDLDGSLWDSVLALKHTVQLQFLHLGNCDGISAPWDNLCGLSEVEKGTIATTPLLSNLKSIQIEQCHKVKNLPPARLLPNLQKIRVWHCRGMEEVFGTDQEGEQVGLNLPQLVLLELLGLPELRNIYNGAITCHSLYDIRFVDCPKLERITIPLPQPRLQILQFWPEEWWESVQWGSANDRIHLESLAGFWIGGYGSHLLHRVKRRQADLVTPDLGDGSAFWTKRLVGEAFVENEGKIWSWLMDDRVLRVCIYGMAGVGKTTLMKQIQTRLKGHNSFEVYWITVSQEFSICKLQNLIAKKIGLNFSDEEDEVKRAKSLAQAMQAKGKCVLILDDLWNDFDVDDAGIPVKAGGCKLVLTTRLLNVCQKMDCDEGNIIQVQALSRPEAWIMFTKELGNYSTEVEQLAKLVAIECDGLPLGIRVMARAMKGIREVHSWRTALEELRESKLSEGHKMREEVFPVLKFSYLHLIDPALRKCLLYCALFPEDHKIDRGKLIEYMIVEGIIDAKKSRRAEVDKGHTMLDTLVNACLLESDTTDVVWMHDLIRDMAIYELREGSNTLVEAGAQLQELPDLEEWTENLVCVSLMYNDIEVIPFHHTPSCPDLSTLLLCGNYGLRKIAGSFLKQFQKLKVLDLSRCEEIEELPVDVSDLVNLTALLLRECMKLSHVPSLAKLKRLKKLDLSSCHMLERMPEGVEFLINLKHLDLSLSGIERIGSEIRPNLKHLDLSLSGIERIGSEIRPKLSGLQVLNLGKTKVSVKGREVGRLEKLEILECNFDDTKEWREYMKSREKSQQSLTHYFFVIGEVIQCWRASLEFFRHDDWRSSSGVYLWGGGSSSNDYVALPLPTDIQVLIIEDDLNGSLWDSVLALKHTVQLHFLHLGNCDGISAPWDNLCGLSEVEKGTIATTPLLSNLKSIQIEQCHKVKNLPPARLLPNLQKIRVWYCRGMEEVFGTDQEGEQVGLNLPQLGLLELWGLPELRSIYNGAITCHSLYDIRFVDCPKLERITIPLPQPRLQILQVWPKEWWESVQWGSANDKIDLESVADFRMYGYWSDLLHDLKQRQTG